jgi:peptidoglycan/xylan/chitin deacetylase (PgdA/CDA1 family)
MFGRPRRFRPEESHRVALTFDDGPDDVHTPRVLDILAAHGVTATFFCVGRQVERYPDVLRRMRAEGHVVANHTARHLHLTAEAPDTVRREIEEGRDAIRAAGGVNPRWLRPPFGDWNPDTDAVAAELGLDVVLWDVDSVDWSGIPGPAVAANVLGQVTGDAIVLHHSAGNVAGTVEALPYELAVGAARGWSFVPLGELVGSQPYREG